MDLSVRLDQANSRCRFSCQISEPRIFDRGRENFFLFNWNNSCYRGWFSQGIRCSSVEQGLKPRPKHPTSPLPKPLENEQVVVGKEDNMIMTDSDFSSEICGKIEKMVFHGLFQEALELFEILECETGESNVGISTYDALIRACIGLKSVRGVKRVLNYMGSCGFEPDQYLSNRLLLMHVKCGMMMDALKLFDDMPERNVVSWNTIIGGLLDAGDYHGAFGLFLMMWDDFVSPDSRMLAMMMRASAGLALIYPGRQLHSLALKTDVNDDIYVSCALIDMYSKCGSIDDARCVFDEIPDKTTVAWNSIIAGYALHGYSEEAMNMYYEMQDSGVKMDHFTFSIILRVCTRLASLEHAKQAHAGLVRHGLGLDVVANTALMDFYSKWGRIEDAQNVFNRMQRKNVICWNALIGGYGIHGRGVEAVDLFHQMVSEGYTPNHVTFLAVLSACSYSGLSDHGWQIFESMSRVYKVKPRAMHYACMIELLGREGLLDEAFALIRDAPFKPTLNMWAALLTACRIHRNFVLGKLAAEKLYGMEPEKLSNYVVLLNIYNASGKLREAADVTHTLRRKGLRMLPACTWIEIKKKPYVFSSADKSHSQTKDIYDKLDKLMREISEKGYAPGERSLLADVDDHEEELRPHHSEKLAISFGIINTVDSTQLNLVQNHRMCFDCHNAIKLIALVTNRRIILRDASRFHRFQGGTCSCGDYW